MLYNEYLVGTVDIDGPQNKENTKAYTTLLPLPQAKQAGLTEGMVSKVLVEIDALEI